MNKRQINQIKRIARLSRLEHEQKCGKPRSKSWGGKPSSKQDRKTSKRNLGKEI